VVRPRLLVTTAVVSLKGRVRENGGHLPAGVVYIGGQETRGGWHLAKTKWANPFRDGPLAERLARYRAHVLASPELRAALPELRGQVLACWCVPRPCHGHVLAALADALPD
jgi:hypothetical protein